MNWFFVVLVAWRMFCIGFEIKKYLVTHPEDDKTGPMFFLVALEGCLMYGAFVGGK